MSLNFRSSCFLLPCARILGAFHYAQSILTFISKYLTLSFNIHICIKASILQPLHRDSGNLTKFGVFLEKVKEQLLMGHQIHVLFQTLHMLVQQSRWVEKKPELIFTALTLTGGGWAKCCAHGRNISFFDLASAYIIIKNGRSTYG